LQWLFLAVLVLAAFFTMFASMRMAYVVLVVQLVLILVLTRSQRKAFYLIVIMAISVPQFFGVTMMRQAGVPSIVSDLDAPQVVIQNQCRRGVKGTKAARVLNALMVGRYFDDIFKVSHIGLHYPNVVPFTGTFAMPTYEVQIPETIEEFRPGCPRPPEQWVPLWTTDPGAGPGDIARLETPKYLAAYVFAQPGNGVTPGLTGWLYLSFAKTGVAVGFLILGMLHFGIFGLMRSSYPTGLGKLLGILVFPSLTLLVMNSNLISVVARVASDAIVAGTVFLLGLYLARFAWIKQRPDQE
jgi:hypothetical protein